MPTLCTFYGITVRMYYDDHGPPHVHAIYADAQVLIDIETLEVLRGGLPRRALALVLEWAKLRQLELRAAWKRAEAHEPLGTIPPLD
jgi:hypothetical protein